MPAMIWETGVGLAIAVLAAVALWSLLRMRGEFGRVRSSASALGVWIIYLLHLAIVIVSAVRMLWPVPMSIELALTAGAVLLAGGVTLCGAGMWKFGSVRRMFGREHSRLITDGIYAWSRNPQNVGWILAQFGISLMGRSGLALLMSTVFAGIFLIYIRYEERHLENVFGDEYRDYLQRSHRFVGLPSPLATPGPRDAGSLGQRLKAGR
jgi:protein-S-isoprenylcysteine O-methyltransferase Ste14